MLTRANLPVCLLMQGAGRPRANRRRGFDASRGASYNARMTYRQPLALDLHLDRGDDGLVTHVHQSPAGQGDSRFVSPFSQRDLDKLWATIHEVQATGSATATQRAMVQDAGKRLFQAAFAGEVLGCLRASFDRAQFERMPLRVLLDLSATPELISLPWELMYNPERSEYVGLARHTPFARFTNLQHRILPVSQPKPLRMLVVVAGPTSYPRVQVDHEWIDLLDSIDFLGASGKLIVERLQKPTLLDLQRKLRQGEYHIIHFIGHGVRDSLTGEGQLVLEDEMGRSRLVSGEHLGALMRDHYTLRHMTIAAPTRVPVVTDYGALLDVGRHLVRRGVAAVVAPQYAVTHAAWLAFCQTLYRQLADWHPVDLAVVLGRLAMAEEADDFNWAAPILTSRVVDGVLFDDGTRPPIEEPEGLQESVTARLNSLRLRAAGADAADRWREELFGRRSPRDRR